MGNHLWSCGQNKEIQVWDAQTLKPINLLKGHSSYVNDLVKIECLETRYVWSFSTGDGSVCVWRTEHSTSQDSGDVFAQTIAEVNDLEGRLQELNERMSEESDKWYFGESRRSLERQEFKRTITGLGTCLNWLNVSHLCTCIVESQFDALRLHLQVEAYTYAHMHAVLNTR